MRIAVAGFEYEGNSCSAKIDGRDSFADKILWDGPELLARAAGKGLALTGGIDVVRAAGHEIVPIFAMRGGAGGKVEAGFARACMNRIIEGIAGAGRLDGVYLALHGAMLTEDLDDPEGALLSALRQRVGPALPIAASLDLHAHVTRRMIEAATVLVGYQTYPHEDAYETGARAAHLLVRTLAGEIRPVMRKHTFNAILPVLGGGTNPPAPMAEVAALARAIEQRPGLHAVSYFPVQPWLDAPDVGITGLAVAQSAEAAAAAAAEVATAMWDRRRAFELEAYTPIEAVRIALTRPARTVLLVDAPDSIGAGAPGDNPGVLAAILAAAPDVPAAVYLVDPPAVRAATAAGVGATLTLDVGAAHDQRFHPPVRMTAKVEQLLEASFTYTGGPARGAKGRLGATAVLRCGELRLLAATNAVYEYGAEHYAAGGIDITQMRLVACKNLMNFRTLLGPQCEAVAVHGPGASPLRLQDVAWRHRRRPFWPCDDVASPAVID
jgi:microcystin degradation protein MlrC